VVIIYDRFIVKCCRGKLVVEGVVEGVVKNLKSFKLPEK
jgi:hypothetical protein